MEKKLIKIVRNLPILRLYIEVPFLSVRTHLMSYSYAEDLYEYIALEIRIHKWSTQFILYKNRIYK